MPGKDGIQLITRVNDIKHSVRTILMTTFDVHDKLFQEYSKKQIMNGFAQKGERSSDENEDNEEDDEDED